MGKSDWKNNRKSQKVTGKITENIACLFKICIFAV